MKRVWLILLHELASQAANTWIRVATAGAVLLALLVARTGSEDYRIRYDQFVQLSEQLDATRTRKSGLSGLGLDVGLRVLHAPAIGSTLVRGLESSMPIYWDFSPSGVVSGPTTPSLAQDSEVGSVLDLESLVRTVLGLLALVLGLHMVAGERAAGTLSGLLSQPVHRAAIAIGKILAGALTLGAALVLSSFAAVGSVAIQFPEVRTSNNVQALLGFGVAAFLYLVVLLALGMIIGALTRAYSTALILGISIWVYVAFVGPQLVVFAVRTVAPVASAHQQELERQKVFDARLRNAQVSIGQRFPELGGREALALDYVPKSNVREEIERLWKSEALETRRIVEAIDERLVQGRLRQARLMRWFALASPGSVLLNAATNLADTGRPTLERWERDVRDQQRTLNKLLFDDPPRLILLVPGGSLSGFNRRPLPTLKTIRPFEMRVPDSLRRVRDSATELIVLVVYLLFGVGSAVATFPHAELAEEALRH
jgi:ABC-type transport system involved in multi-copper enzyme maturation permease subunit